LAKSIDFAVSLCSRQRGGGPICNIRPRSVEENQQYYPIFNQTMVVIKPPNEPANKPHSPLTSRRAHTGAMERAWWHVSNLVACFKCGMFQIRTSSVTPGSCERISGGRPGLRSTMANI
jgi:hypothetical protein